MKRKSFLVMRTSFFPTTPKLGTGQSQTTHSPALSILCLNRSEDVLGPAMDQLLLSKAAPEKDQASEAVRLFLNHDGNRNLKTTAGNSYISESIRHKNPNLFRQLLNTQSINGKMANTNPDLLIKPDVNQANGLGTTPLMAAIIYGAGSAAPTLLDQGADVMAQDKGGRTACDWAALKGDKPLVELLTQQAGPRLAPKKKDEFKKLADDQEACIRRFRKLSSQKKRRQLGDAISAGDVSKIIALVSAGMPINAPGWEWDTVIHQAAFQGQPEAVKVLAQLGADVTHYNPNGFNPLMLAIMGKRTVKGNNSKYGEVLQALIDAGADVNLPNRYGETPLVSAFSSGQMEFIQPLLLAGADAKKAATYTVPSIGVTTLMTAIRNGVDTNVVRMIIKAGANVNADEEYGMTALMLAASKGKIETVKALLAAGADVHLKTSAEIGQKTALTFAQENGHADVAQVLQEAEDRVTESAT